MIPPPPCSACTAAAWTHTLSPQYHPEFTLWGSEANFHQGWGVSCGQWNCFGSASKLARYWVSKKMDLKNPFHRQIQQLNWFNATSFWSPIVCIPVQRWIRIYLLIADHHNSHCIKHPAIQNESEAFRIVRICKREFHTFWHKFFWNLSIFLFCCKHSSWRYFENSSWKLSEIQSMQTNANARIQKYCKGLCIDVFISFYTESMLVSKNCKINCEQWLNSTLCNCHLHVVYTKRLGQPIAWRHWSCMVDGSVRTECLNLQFGLNENLIYSIPMKK